MRFETLLGIYNNVLNLKESTRGVPVPPPPPSAAPRRASPEKSQRKTPGKSERREEARDKIRAGKNELKTTLIVM